MFLFFSCEGRWYILTPLYYMSVHPFYTHWLLLGVRVNIETCHNSKKQTCCSAVRMPLATRDALSDLMKVGRGFTQLTPPLSWHSQLLVQHSGFNTNRLSVFFLKKNWPNLEEILVLKLAASYLHLPPGAASYLHLPPGEMFTPQKQKSAIFSNHQ